jgi:hypothetical protein
VAGRTCAAGPLNTIAPERRPGTGNLVANKPWVIGWLGEGYTRPSQLIPAVDKLEKDLRSDPFFGKHYDGWFTRVDVPLESCEPGVSSEGNGKKTALMLKANYSYEECNYDFTEALSRQVGLAAQDIEDLASIVIVANRESTQTGACVFGDLVVLTKSTNKQTLRREFGHLVGGLFDEREGDKVWPDNAPLKGPNCATTSSGVSWLPGQPGCADYANLVRKGDLCRMCRPTDDPALCVLCRETLTESIKTYGSAPHGNPEPYYQLIVRLYEEGGQRRAQVVGKKAFKGIPRTGSKQRSELIVGLQNAAREVVCVASPAQDRLRQARAYIRTSDTDDKVNEKNVENDGLLLIFQCPASRFLPGGVPETFVEDESMQVLQTTMRDQGSTIITPQRFRVRWSAERR